MKYYLVNYVILNDRLIVRDDTIAIALDKFGQPDDFKNTISQQLKVADKIASVVIKNYSQVAEDVYASFSKRAEG